MSSPKSISSARETQAGIQFSDSAMVPGVTCHLILGSPISDQPSAAELALISSLLPELIEQLLFDADVDF